MLICSESNINFGVQLLAVANETTLTVQWILHLLKHHLPDWELPGLWINPTLPSAAPPAQCLGACSSCSMLCLLWERSLPFLSINVLSFTACSALVHYMPLPSGFFESFIRKTKLVRAQLGEKTISLPCSGSMTWTAKRDSAHEQRSSIGVIYGCGLRMKTREGLRFLPQKHLVKSGVAQSISKQDVVL